MGKAKVTEGRYAGNCDVTRGGLWTLRARDAAPDNRLRGKVTKSDE